MNALKSSLLKVFSPATHRKVKHESRVRADLEAQVERLKTSFQVLLQELQQVRQTLTTVADQRDLCTENLMTLVALDEDGHWTTVFDSDTRLPEEISGYLGELVARA